MFIMKKYRIISLLVSFVFCVLFMACASDKKAEITGEEELIKENFSSLSSVVSNGSENVSVEDLDSFVLDKYLEPIFEGDHVYNETAMMLQNEEGKLPTVSLYYPITEIVSVRNYALDILYQNGKDYVLENGKIRIPDGSAIYNIACPDNKFNFTEYVNDGTMWPLAGQTGGQMRTESEYGNLGLTKYQIAVTYKHSGSFGIQSPANKSEKLPKTNAKLRSGEQFSIVCLGDSISAGWSASGYGSISIKPYMPQYFNLVSMYLKNHYNDKLVSTNLSVGGMTSTWGADAKRTGDAISANPDLMFIAFGMNEGIDYNFTPAYYKTQIKSIIDQVRAKCPNTEFVLVATMLPNAVIGNDPTVWLSKGASCLERQADYLFPLTELQNEYQGVAVADVTAVHAEKKKKKAFRDMSTNNINHPNDFVQRLYAQIALRTIIGK